MKGNLGKKLFAAVTAAGSKIFAAVFMTPKRNIIDDMILTRKTSNEKNYQGKRMAHQAENKLHCIHQNKILRNVIINQQTDWR